MKQKWMDKLISPPNDLKRACCESPAHIHDAARIPRRCHSGGAGCVHRPFCPQAVLDAAGNVSQGLK